jgi:predicted dehydrogenase
LFVLREAVSFAARLFRATNMNEIRIGLAGLGPRGLYMLQLLQRIKGFCVVALCDPVAATHERARESLRERGGVRFYIDYEKFLADPEMDAVMLTVRCKEQGAMAAMALEAGRHANSEVPAAHTIEDCWRIVLAQERSGLVYQLAEQVRYAGYVAAWRKLVAEGALGTITYAEGQYLHYIPERMIRDGETGQYIPVTEWKSHPRALPGWLAVMPPIHYVVHDLSPLLKVLDDRVVEVVGMSTPSPSAAHPELASPDMQVALMKTAKGALLRMMASFSQPHPRTEHHWLQIIGTRGSVEWKRSAHDKPKLWLADSGTPDKADMDWTWERPNDPPEVRESGHGGLDYHVHAAFRDAIFGIRPLEFDVYRAMDVAAPSILAAESIARGSKSMPVPDFRPGKVRAAGRPPRS